jgi:hypothetical protein
MMNERLICRNGENTLDTTTDWDLIALDATGEGAGADGVEEDDGDWELESLEHEGEVTDAR